jgi:hypothetical protein
MQRHRRPYGRDRKQYGCCPGHDEYPSETNSNNRSKRAKSRVSAMMRRRFRRNTKQEINNARGDHD